MPLVPPEKGVVGGVVSTVEGVPFANVRVEARSTNPFESGVASTAADGSYRIALPPGTYTVSAGGPEIVAPQREAEVYTSHRQVKSAPVPVRSRRGVRVDFQLPPGPQLFSITVHVVDGAGRPVPGATVRSFVHREPIDVTFGGSAVTGAKGAAVLRPLTPGPVTIVATAMRAPADLAAMTSVEIVDAPVDGVTMVVLPGATFSGRIEFAGRTAPLHGSGGLRLIFDPPGFSQSWTSADPGLMRPDGTFALGGLIGERCLRLTDVPAGWTLKEVTHQGIDLTNQILRFEPGDIYADVIIRIERGQPPYPPLGCQR